METGINDRVSHLLKVLNLSRAAFAGAVGASTTAIQSAVKGRNKPGFDIIEGIMRAFPKVNPYWLILGNGDMFLTDSRQIAEKSDAEALSEKNRQLEQQNQTLQMRNQHLVRELLFQKSEFDLLLEKSEGVLNMQPNEPLFKPETVHLSIHPLALRG